MSKLFNIIVLIGLCATINSCKKHQRLKPIVPTLNYGIYHFVNNTVKFSLDTSMAYTIATNEDIPITNLSKGADNYFWDFGNGNTSTEKEPKLSYEKSGQYTLTLKVASEGKEYSLSKTVTVLDRVLKSIKIKSINWNSNFSYPLNWPNNKKGTLFIEIKELPNGSFPEFKNGQYNGIVLYKSELIDNVTIDSMPMEVIVDDKHIIEFSKLFQGKYGFNLHVTEDNTDYLLSSSWGSGVGISYEGNIPSNNFVISTSFNGNQIDFVCVYQ